MNLWGKAIIAGIAIEGMLFAVMFAGGLGPCGPGSSVGWVIMILHYPAMWAVNVFAKLNLPESAGLPLVLVISAAQWSSILYVILRWRQKR